MINWFFSKQGEHVVISPKLITVDGIDGAGKSTICEILKEEIEKITGVEAIVVKQCNGLPVGDMIRQFLSKNEIKQTNQSVLMHLFLAGIAETYFETIQPALQDGKYVIMDRSDLSTCVYQNLAEDIERNTKQFRETYLNPVVSVVVDVPPEVAVGRMKGRGELDCMEDVSVETIAKRRQGFLEVKVSKHTSKCIIDGTKSPDSIREHLHRIILQTHKKSIIV